MNTSLNGFLSTKPSSPITCGVLPAHRAVLLCNGRGFVASRAFPTVNDVGSPFLSARAPRAWFTGSRPLRCYLTARSLSPEAIAAAAATPPYITVKKETCSHGFFTPRTPPPPRICLHFFKELKKIASCGAPIFFAHIIFFYPPNIFSFWAIFWWE